MPLQVVALLNSIPLVCSNKQLIINLNFIFNPTVSIELLLNILR